MNVTSTSEDCTINEDNEDVIVESQYSTLIQFVKKNYINDTNSTMAAGKKEFITRNKTRMQKRF